MAEARNRLAELIDAVSDGDFVYLTRRGKRVAALIPGIPGTGYTHDGQRWQNPGTGGFTQDTRDLLGNPATGNRYVCASGNPANYEDPAGNESISLNPAAENEIAINMGLANYGCTLNVTLPTFYGVPYGPPSGSLSGC